MTRASCVTFVNRLSRPRNSSNTKAPKFVVRVSIRNSLNVARNAKKFYEREAWPVVGRFITVIASNARFATRRLQAKLSNRKTETVTACLATNNSTLNVAPAVIVIS